MELRGRYERAKQRFDSARGSMTRDPLPGDQGKSQQAVYLSAFRQMERLRNELIAHGEWEGPRPIPLREKYR